MHYSWVIKLVYFKKCEYCCDVASSLLCVMASAGVTVGNNHRSQVEDSNFSPTIQGLQFTAAMGRVESKMSADRW